MISLLVATSDLFVSLCFFTPVSLPYHYSLFSLHLHKLWFRTFGEREIWSDNLIPPANATILNFTKIWAIYSIWNSQIITLCEICFVIDQCARKLEFSERCSFFICNESQIRCSWRAVESYSSDQEFLLRELNADYYFHKTLLLDCVFI